MSIKRPTPTNPFGAGAISEEVTADRETVRLTSSQNADPVLDFVREAKGHFKKGADQHYVGSVPILVCQIWAKECRAPIGTREWRAYAHRKLHSGEFSKLRAHL